jgi:DNA-directed DNA polymerase III PolC
VIPNFPTCHSHPLSFDSASTPEAFAERELELGTGTLTVTDHGTLHACRKVYDIAKAKKLTPILGLEAYVRDDNCPILTAAGVQKDADGTFKSYAKYMHLTIHFLDQAAYECGIRLLSKADERAERHGSERKPLFDWNTIEELGGQNVTMTTSCLVGVVQRHLLDHDSLPMAVAHYERLRSVVKPGNLYVEVFPHDCSKNWVEGIFLRLANGTETKYWAKKKLRTNKGEVFAMELAKAFTRPDHGHRQLVAIMNNRKWEDVEPVDIMSCDHVADFMQNECTSWAPDGDVQNGINRVMTILAKKYGDKILIGDDSHFANPEEKIVQDVRLSQGGSWRFYGSYHRQSSAEALAFFKAKMGVSEKQFEGWVDNAYEWAGRFKNFELKSEPSLPTKFFEPEYKKYSWCKDGAKDNSLKYTMELIKKHGRMDWSKKDYVARLQAEIKLLHHNGTIDLLPYFFVVEDVCSFFERRGKPTGPGRGSAAGMLLTYLLGITHVDPLKYGLSLERFLTLDRIQSGKFPDIDQDISKMYRHLLIDPETGWLKEKYGDHFAQISVDTTLKLRSAVLDVARFRGRDMVSVVKLTKKFDEAPQGVTDHDFVLGYESDDGILHQGSMETDPSLKQYILQYPDDWDVVKKCLGLARQKGRHACAFAIANRPINEIIPLTTVSGIKVTSYTAASVEASGVLKYDFLGVGALDDIGDAIQMIQKRHAHTVDMSQYKIIEHEEDLIGWSGQFVSNKRFSIILNGKRVPSHRLIPFEGKMIDLYEIPDDQASFGDIATSQTETVFQFSTPGAKELLGNFAYKKPNGNYAIDSIESMSAFTALDRPGPLDMFVRNPETGGQHNLLVEYARRARGAAKSPEILKAFDDLVPETFGVMVYQEQLQKIYQSLTGCSGTEAEEFRSDVAKKKKSKIEKAYKPFIEKASTKIGKESAEAAWQFFLTWAKYGFNKSHSICYSVLGYACVWLKRHYKLEWWCSVLKNAGKKEVNEKFWKYAGDMIDLPDITISGVEFEIQNDRIRAPLNLLHGIGAKAHQQINDCGPYKDIVDFVQKLDDWRVANGQKVVQRKKVKEKIRDPEQPNFKNGKPKFKTIEVERDVEVMKKAHNALNRKVVYTLIMSGVMDSLFPKTLVNAMGVEEEVLVFDQLREFEKAQALVTGKKEEPVDEKYLSINGFQRFQQKKAILPVFSQDLIPLVENVKSISTFKDSEGRTCFNWPIPRSRTEEVMPVRIVFANEIEDLDNATMLPDPPYIGAAIAYVEFAESWTFIRDDGPQEACKMTFDIDGLRLHELVKWSGKDGKIPENFKQPLKGAIAIVVLNKYREGKPFGIEDVIVVQPPLDLAAQASPDPEPEPKKEEDDESGEHSE